jgi:hypothetical protein
MITQLSQTVTTTEAAGSDGELQLQDRRRDVTLSIPSGYRVTAELLGGCVEFEIRPTDSEGAVDWQQPDRENLQVRFYSAGPDVIASAVVQYVARKHHTTESQFCSDREKAEAVELLRRVAGAMGLTYDAPTPAAADA